MLITATTLITQGAVPPPSILLTDLHMLEIAREGCMDVNEMGRQAGWGPGS